MDDFHKKLKENAERKREELLAPLYYEFKNLLEKQKEKEALFNEARRKGRLDLEKTYTKEIAQIRAKRKIDDKLIKRVEDYSYNEINSNYEKIYLEIKHRFKEDLVEEHRYKGALKIGLVAIVFLLLGLEISQGIQAEYAKNLFWLFLGLFAVLIGFAVTTKHKRRLAPA